MSEEPINCHSNGSCWHTLEDKSDEETMLEECKISSLEGVLSAGCKKIWALESPFSKIDRLISTSLSVSLPPLLFFLVNCLTVSARMPRGERQSQVECMKMMREAIQREVLVRDSHGLRTSTTKMAHQSSCARQTRVMWVWPLFHQLKWRFLCQPTDFIRRINGQIGQ